MRRSRAVATSLSARVAGAPRAVPLPSSCSSAAHGFSSSSSSSSSSSWSHSWWSGMRSRHLLRRLPLCLAPLPFAASHRTLTTPSVTVASGAPEATSASSSAHPSSHSSPSSPASSSSSPAPAPAPAASDEAPFALVVLLGWLGCEDKHLKKYADLWERTGRQVVVYSPSSLTVFAPEQGQEKVQQLLDRIQHQIGTHGERPVLWHAMSNNGAYHYAFASTFLTDRKRYPTLEKETCGVVYDSAPSHLSIDVMTRGFTSFIAGRWGALTYDHWALSPIVRSMFTGVLSLPHYDRQVQRLGESLAASSPVWASQMFLYSDADALIPSQDVLAFADRQWLRRRHVHAATVHAGHGHGSHASHASHHHHQQHGHHGHHDPHEHRVVSRQPTTKANSEIVHTRMSLTGGGSSSASHGHGHGAGAGDSVGVQQWRVAFPNSGHVEHGRRFPREYEQACDSFARHAERHWHATRAERERDRDRAHQL